MGVTLYIIGTVLFLLYHFFTKRTEGFKQWWKGLEELPYAIVTGSLFVMRVQETINQYKMYQLLNMDQTKLWWHLLYLVWFIASVYCFAKLYQKKQYRRILIGLGWIAILIAAQLIS